MDRCRECGAGAPLNAQGVCVWRAGCEHRQMVSEAIQVRIDAALTSGTTVQVIVFAIPEPDAVEVIDSTYRWALAQQDPSRCLHCVAATN